MGGRMPMDGTMKKPVDVNALKSEVACFASSLGLAAPNSAAGFDDSDFRKSGPINSKPRPNNSSFKKSKDENIQKKNRATNGRAVSKPTLKSQPFWDGERNANSLRRNDKYRELPKLPLVKANTVGVWYEDAKELERKVLGEAYDGTLEVKMDMNEWKRIVNEKKELGDRLMWQFCQDYESSRGQSGDIKMVIATQRSGTAADKVSAFSVLLGDNAVANMRSLDALLGMVASKVGKRHALTGFEVLKELFISSLLPDRKLKSLLQRPLNKLPGTKDGYSLLLLWYWEDCLKQRYERFVSTLEEASKDMLPVLKDKALKTMYMLLKSKSEQERRLLTALVNKLGDPQNKGASNAHFHLSNLLSEHPNMKMVVIDEVDTFLFRPHLGMRAKYLAVNFLSQIRLSNKGEGPRVAKRLIDVYFALFKVLINEKGERDGDTKKEAADNHVELDSRILSALLTGVNRAFPYVSSMEIDDVIEAQTPTLFRLAHSDNFNVGVQSLMLLDKISSRNHVVSERFYRALYSKLLLPAALNSSKAELFTGLLLRAMKSDVNLKRVAAFSKRLLQVALQQPPQYACGCLFVLSEVLKARPPLWNMVQQNESIDDEIEHFHDIVEDEGDDQRPQKDDEAQASAPVSGWYNPRHREPLFSNAERASWWELTVLAGHVHPSVATMARTLLSGANILYNGNPLNDLSLNAFLDKFMEKKPKQAEWHGGSQIEPAKKMDLSNHLIGPEILSLAEVDVPPEDLVFHTFYLNKMSSSKPNKKKKKKKQAADDEAAEELLGVDDFDKDDEPQGGDESDNEEIENILDSADTSFEGGDSGYDYDDLERVEADADDDLVDDSSDMETAMVSDDEDDDGETRSDDSLNFDIGDGDDNASDGIGENTEKKKNKLKRKTGESPFASLEEYEHLINEDESRKQKRTSSKKKKTRKH